jgi:mitochondrial fission protein ELM1
MQAKLWVLLGRKAGDNAQVLALAEASGLPYAEKHISARSWEIVPHLALGPTLAGIDQRTSSPLAPPWPEMVISAGRRNEPVARWIRQQAGGAARLVHVGRPWARPETWDLIVTTPQYFLPDAPNVLQISLPLSRITRTGVDAGARQIAPRLAHLPRPLTTVLIGGDSGPFVFTPDKGRRLAEGVNRLVAQTGGAALVTDSPRTPKAAAEAFRETLDVPAETYWWHDPQTAGDNPYQGLLGMADRFVVTGESMSMMTEAASLGRPLYLFDPGDPPGTWWRHPHNFRHKPLSHALATRLAPQRMRRDVSRLQDALRREGRARWLDEAPQLIAEGENWATALQSDPMEDARRAAARVRALLDQDAQHRATHPG